MILILVGSIAALAMILVLAQRQFEPAEARPATPKPGSTTAPAHPTSEPPPAASPTTGLVPSIVGAIETSARLKPANLHDVEAMGLLRSALAKAIDGEFCAEVGRVIDDVSGIEVMHGMRVATVGDELLDALLVSNDIDHLIVGPSGVFVVTSKVRADKISYDGDSVFVGRGSDRCRDAMVDDIVHSMEAVADAVAPVPVRGIIVLRDLLALPDEIRSTSVEIRGVRLATVTQLPSILSEPGPVNDLALVVARLQAAFEPAFPSGDGALRLSSQG